MGRGKRVFRKRKILNTEHKSNNSFVSVSKISKNNRTRKILDVREQFGEAVGYIKESRSYIYFILAAFFASAFVGFLSAESFTFLDDVLRDVYLQTANLGTLELVFFIMQNNLQSALTGMFFGIVLGIIPFFTAVLNGVVLGYVSNIVVAREGFFFLWRLLPHGILELSAVFIALGMGMKLGFAIFTSSGRKDFKRRFYNSANTFLFVVVPLLIIAAVIEGILIGLRV
jgi:stage II sporulation protein M